MALRTKWPHLMSSRSHTSTPIVHQVEDTATRCTPTGNVAGADWSYEVPRPLSPSSPTTPPGFRTQQPATGESNSNPRGLPTTAFAQGGAQSGSVDRPDGGGYNPQSGGSWGVSGSSSISQQPVSGVGAAAYNGAPTGGAGADAGSRCPPCVCTCLMGRQAAQQGAAALASAQPAPRSGGTQPETGAVLVPGGLGAGLAGLGGTLDGGLGGGLGAGGGGGYYSQQYPPQTSYPSGYSYPATNPYATQGPYQGGNPYGQSNPYAPAADVTRQAYYPAPSNYYPSPQYAPATLNCPPCSCSCYEASNGGSARPDTAQSGGGRSAAFLGGSRSNSQFTAPPSEPPPAAAALKTPSLSRTNASNHASPTAAAPLRVAAPPPLAPAAPAAFRGALARANRYRARHGVQALTWDADLAAAAGAFARTCPRGASGAPGVGENVGWGYRDAAQAVDVWYSEVRDR